MAKGSRLQSVTALSTTEGKDISVGAAPGAAIFLNWHFTDSQKPVGPARDPISKTLLVLGDNQAVLFLPEKRLRPQHLIYCIAAKYSNKRVSQHWFQEGCRIALRKDLMPQRAHNQGDSNAIFGWRIWYNSAKLHICEVRKAFDYQEVLRYTHCV